MNGCCVMDGDCDSDSLVLEDETDDDDYDDWYPYLDEYFCVEKTPPNLCCLQPLVPEGIEDNLSGAIQFAENFSLRYGKIVPNFYVGSLKDAMDEAFIWTGDAELDQLLIYLHHDKSICSNVFCSQVLCSELVAAYLNQNFIIWGWDMTDESNHDRLLQAIECHFGSTFRHYLKLKSANRNEVDIFPLLIVVTRDRRTGETFFETITGNCNQEEAITKLMDASDAFKANDRWSFNCR